MMLIFLFSYQVGAEDRNKEKATILAAKFACDGTTTKIETWGSGESARERITFLKDSQDTELWFTNIDAIGAGCRKDVKGRAYVVFQAYCGGSGCRDLDNYGIFCPKYFRLLLVPSDDNREKASEIMGEKIVRIKSMHKVGTD